MTSSPVPATWLFSLGLFSVLAQPAAAPDPAAIIQKSLEIDRKNWKSLSDYTYVETVESRQLDRKGHVKSTESTTWDVLLLGGAQYRKKIARDGRPLSPRDAAEEEKRFDRERARRLNESQSQRRKRLAKEAEDHNRERAFALQIPEAFHFQLIGDDVVSGEPVWIVSAKPRAGFRPTVPRADILQKVGGRLWIEKRSYQWVRIEAEVLSPVSLGWVLARLKPGTRLSLEQVPVGDIWAPSKADFDIDVRLALVKGIRALVHLERSKYRRFSADSRIISIEESSKQ